MEVLRSREMRMLATRIVWVHVLVPGQESHSFDLPTECALTSPSRILVRELLYCTHSPLPHILYANQPHPSLPLHITPAPALMRAPHLLASPLPPTTTNLHIPVAIGCVCNCAQVPLPDAAGDRREHTLRARPTRVRRSDPIALATRSYLFSTPLHSTRLDSTPLSLLRASISIRVDQSHTRLCYRAARDF